MIEEEGEKTMNFEQEENERLKAKMKTGDVSDQVIAFFIQICKHFFLISQTYIIIFFF